MNFHDVQRFLKTIVYSFLLIASLFTVLPACRSENLSQQRGLHLENIPADNPVKLAVVWGRQYGDSYYRGVQMAAQELNASGGVSGHVIEPFLINQYKTLEEARQAVYPLSEDMDVAFALGFYKSEIAQSLIQLMQYYGLPVMINADVSEILQNQWTSGVFRATVNTRHIGEALYRECMANKAQNVILCYSSELYPQSIASTMISFLRDNPAINTKIYRVDALTNEWRFKLKTVKENPDFRNKKTAAVILLNDLNEIEILLSTLVKNGDIQMAFTTNLNPDMGKQISSRLKIPIFIVADMLEGSSKPIRQNDPLDSFIMRFKQQFDHWPSDVLISGYEQTMTVANAMKAANSVSPSKVIPAIRKQTHKGLIQTYEFTESGELKDPIFFMITIDGDQVSKSIL